MVEISIPKKFLVSQDVETDRKFLRNLNLSEISLCRLSTNVTMHVCVYAWIVTYVDSRQSPVYGPNSLSQNMALLNMHVCHSPCISGSKPFKVCVSGFSKCAGDWRFRRLLSHFHWLKIYRAWVFQQFLCLCELSLSRFVDLHLLIDYFYYCNKPNTNKSTSF